MVTPSNYPVNTPTLDFGRHAGTPVDELPKSYCSWMLGQKWIGSDIRRAVEQLLEVDQPEDDIQPSPELAAVLLPGLVFEWFEEMRYRFDGDRSANEVIGAGLDVLKTICTRYTHKPWPIEAVGVAA